MTNDDLRCLLQTPNWTEKANHEESEKQQMKSYLLNADDIIFDQIEDVAEMKSMTKADFIRESIARNLRYFMKVERSRYEHIQRSKHDLNEPLDFFSNAFWVETAMLKHTITHHASSDDDPETDSFYDTLVKLIDDLTHRVNADENAIEIEYDEELKSITIRRC